MKKFVYLAVIGLVLGLLFISESFMLMIFSSIIIFGIAALGLNILNGYTGQVSIGHGAFVAVGAYVTSVMSMNFHTPFILNILVVIVCAGLLGFLIGLPALRLKGFYLAIATMAFGVAIQQLFAAIHIFGGHGGLYGIPRLIKSEFGMYLFNLGFFILMYFIADVITSSPVGLKYRMVRDSETASKAYGIKLSSVKLNAFVVSAIYGGIAGALYAHTITYISPADFGLGLSINLLSMIIIGGMATLEGGLIGSVIITGLPFLFSRTKVPMSIIIGALIIIFVLFFPRGLSYGLKMAFLKYLQMPLVWFRKLRARRAKRDGDWVEVNGKKIFYTSRGEGKPIVMLHGNLGCGLWYSRVMDLPGYRTIALDMVNFGRSDRIKDSEMSSYALYLRGFIEKLGFKDVFLVAHSLGGAVAMEMAFDAPELVSRLLLIDPCPIDGLHTPEEHYPFLELYKSNPRMLKKSLLAIAPHIGDMKFLNSLTDNAYLMNRDSFIAHPRGLDKVNLTERAKSFKKPVLVVAGAEDILINREMAEATADALGGSVLILENIGHSLMVEDPDLFKEVLLNFDE
ncbi:MAG: alpha/beta fold hydrolase [Spirochaetales bacterium]|nr:alpha/beta fold hydrolase [Spirochaetales bacterium]